MHHHQQKQKTAAEEEAEEEGDTSAPPVPKSHGSGVENANKSGEETNEIDPREKSVQTEIKCNDISPLQDDMNNISSELLNHVTKAETFSSYKPRNTLTFLIGVTPQDVITGFIQT